MNPYIAKLEREKLERQISEFFAKGNEPKQLGVTELKPHRFIVNSKEENLAVKLPPIHERGCHG